AYFLSLNKYINEGDKILDVGFGLGYGLNVLAIKACEVNGVDIDKEVYEYLNELFNKPEHWTIEHIFWLANLPPKFLGIYTKDVYYWLENLGFGAFIPLFFKNNLLVTFIEKTNFSSFLSTSNRIPSIIASPGIEKPKFVALR
ncbi:hypothetical protein LCGC14_2648680, partial [marine sediment metagenome]